MKEKILIAMSGGVDSSVAAYLMQRQGCDCIGVTMRLFLNSDAGMEKGRTCCSLDDVEDARSVACRLGIPYYVFNFTEDFREQVIKRFADAYEHGATPNPCIDCNRFLKFARLIRRARELGCDAVATGHYARIEQKNGRFLLKKAVDPGKDQSYVLYSLTQEQLAYLRFPLGEKTKAEVRETAEALGFSNARKPDSQDICFVPDGDYAAFIRRYTGKNYPDGPLTDRDGNRLGTHHGIIGYTVGQRRGLGVSSSTRLYVTDILPEENRVILGPADALLRRELDVGNVNFIAWTTPPREFRACVRLRYHQSEQWADITVTEPTRIHIRFDEPQRAVTRGQAAVLYDGDIVLGGGEIL